MIPGFADGFRQLGHEVTTVIKEKHAFYPEIEYDVDISRNTVLWRSSITRSQTLAMARRNINRAGLLTRLLPLIAKHDVFVFLWAGTSLTEHNREFPLLKKLGKKIVSLFCGGDVRHSSGYSQLFASLISENACIDFHNLRADFANEPLSRPLRDMRTAERYSDLVLSTPNNSMLAVRPYKHFLVPVNLSHYKGNIPEREIPLVVHAPSDKGVKGTDLILSVLDQIKREGVSFELLFLHGVPHQQVLAGMSDADVVVDQLHLPLHGVLGIEAMASGCALASCNRDEYEPFPPNRPIWHIDPNSLYSQLKCLLTDKELRIRLAREGRKYAERYHDHVQVGRRMLDALEADKAGPYDHYPSFFARDYRLPSGVEIPADLKELTAKIVQRWGLPGDVDPQDMIAKGLMSAQGLTMSRSIPRWNGSPSPA